MWMSSSIGQNPTVKILPSLANNMWWNIVMDDWNLDENGGDNNFNIVDL